MQHGPNVKLTTNKCKQMKIIYATDITSYENTLLSNLLKTNTPKRQIISKACPCKINFLRPTLSITFVLVKTPSNCTMEIKTISNCVNDWLSWVILLNNCFA